MIPPVFRVCAATDMDGVDIAERAKVKASQVQAARITEDVCKVVKINLSLTKCAVVQSIRVFKHSAKHSHKMALQVMAGLI